MDSIVNSYESVVGPRSFSSLGLSSSTEPLFHQRRNNWLSMTNERTNQLILLSQKWVKDDLKVWISKKIYSIVKPLPYSNLILYSRIAKDALTESPSNTSTLSELMAKQKDMVADHDPLPIPLGETDPSKFSLYTLRAPPPPNQPRCSQVKKYITVFSLVWFHSFRSIPHPPSLFSPLPHPPPIILRHIEVTVKVTDDYSQQLMEDYFCDISNPNLAYDDPKPSHNW